ncbi:MAG: 30S ribosomal protein S7 [Candidatus Micrarchaeaceae archaeon]|jgi:small subunit ribosomal protein S7
MAEAKTPNVEIKTAEAPKPATAAKPKRVKVEKPVQKEESNSMSSGSTLLFDKYDYNVEIQDLSLKNYVNLKPLAYPSTYRRQSQKSFSKANLNIVERLSNSLMRGGTGGKIGGHIIRTKGRLQGKKLKTMHIIENAFQIINKQTGKNPLQVLIRALENSAPIEDTTRVVYGGIKSNVAVDISASRRLDIAIRNITMATIIGAFGNKRSISEALANELILAANVDVNSYAIKRKNEIERMARSAK